MDPLSALSVAGTVIQFVDFSSKLLRTTHQLYKSTSGASSVNEEIELATRDLSNLIIKLRRPLGSTAATNDAAALEELCEACSAVATELIGRLDGLKIQGGGQPHIFRSLGATMKAAWAKGDIEELRSRLSGFREVLEMRIIVGLRDNLLAKRSQDFYYFDLGTMSSDPIPVDESQRAPQRRSILYDIAKIVRRSQIAAKRRSILYDIAHIVLPVSFFFHFVITGTVVLIYTLYLHQPIPARYSIGSAIAFGILTALILLAHLWLYCRRRQKQLNRREDAARASTANSDAEKELENSSPATDRQRHRKLHKRWSVSVRDFLLEYEEQHYRDILTGWTAPWHVKGREISWDGVRDGFDEFFEPVTRILSGEAVRRGTRRHASIVDFMALASSRAPASVEAEPVVAAEAGPGTQAVHAGPVNLNHDCVTQNKVDVPDRRFSRYESPGDVGVSTEVHADGMFLRERNRSLKRKTNSNISDEVHVDDTFIRDRNMGSVARGHGAQMLGKGTTPEPHGLCPSPPHHKKTFPEDIIQPVHTTEILNSHRPQALAVIGPPQRSLTPVPPPVARGNSFQQLRMNGRRRHDPTPYEAYRSNSQLPENPTFRQQQQNLPPDLRISSEFRHLVPGCRASQVSNLSVDMLPNITSNHHLRRHYRELSPDEVLPPSPSISRQQIKEPGAKPPPNPPSNNAPKLPAPAVKKHSPIWDKTAVSIGPKTPPQGRPASWMDELAATARGREKLVSTLEGLSK